MEQKYSNLNLLLNVAAITIILITVVASMFQFEILRIYCVCISNYLAYSSIALGLSLMLGLVWNFLPGESVRKRYLILQAILFFTGIVMLVLFGSFLNNVI